MQSTIFDLQYFAFCLMGLSVDFELIIEVIWVCNRIKVDSFLCLGAA